MKSTIGISIYSTKSEGSRQALVHIDPCCHLCHRRLHAAWQRSVCNSDPVARPKGSPGTKNSRGGHEAEWCNVVTIFFLWKYAILALFLMCMVHHIGFTMKITVYHGPHGRQGETLDIGLYNRCLWIFNFLSCDREMRSNSVFRIWISSFTFRSIVFKLRTLIPNTGPHNFLFSKSLISGHVTQKCCQNWKPWLVVAPSLSKV